MCRQRERDRRVARPWAGDRMAHSTARQLVDQGLDRCIGAVDRDHLGMSEPAVLFLPGFMQRADAWSEVAGAVGERYPSKVLDFETWTFEERLAEISGAAAPGAR